ncbi:MAG: NTP transferase domain-containing protein [Armatimonadota bacterium]|nr:NTP transferase domain-containing protein [Armatimonadota bacterium]
MREELAAVVTAGGRIEWAEFVFATNPVDYPPWQEYPYDDYMVKTLLKVGQRTLLETVLEAIWCSRRVQEVVVVGSPFLRYWVDRAGERLISERLEAHENLIAGLQALLQYPRVLYLTSDLPFVTAESVVRFIDACPPDAQLCYAIVRREVFDARFPNSPSTYARLKDGEFVAGCAMMVEPVALLARADWIRDVAQRRKSLWRLAMLAGFNVLWKYATRRLTVADVERRAERLLGMRCRAVECDPELAYDIDTPEEYEYARRLADVGAG